MIDISELLAAMQTGLLAPWADRLPEQVAKGLDTRRYGDIPKWQHALEQLPDIHPSQIDLNAAYIQVGAEHDVNEDTRKEIETVFRQLHPWRKGPYNLFGIHIETEWRSDWKWDRVKNHIEPLHGRTVMDVGCGNGYHCWRIAGEGAERVIGIDPTPLFVIQFLALKHFIGQMPVDVLPLGIDDVPPQLAAFDTVFSMGVLYHRRSPLDHILQLRDCLKPGGELVLETLIVEGDDSEVLMPEDRYASMANVWFIPSTALLVRWLKRCGLQDVRVVDVTPTTTEEQHSTDWMRFHSLREFLDPDDPTKTIEGYPAPVRCVVVANRT
ncbi:MAG: tRNA 5-methoxyuridine(34)/uridine 5-oxyacetic acid(34) synthase CmoB [Proteobacteria bacterium]|jgi:tRNA (mo5U34)-methyltransferase|nr:tRNA 5-methoxyuridine(34)/uridine 5-oxyacetic acid(34) synthase CmoB [Pseudomonadota bacterium]